MAHFNPSLPNGENNFIKHDSTMLMNFYGTSDVYPYWVADMDFQVATPITAELSRLAERGVYSYEFNEKEVFKSISDWALKRHSIELAVEGFVQVPGVLSGIALILRHFTNADDAVMINSPAYHQFSSLINKAGRKVVKNDLAILNGRYTLDIELMEKQIVENDVKTILFCNPHNPTGRVWTKQELQSVTELAEKYGVMIISDEIHSDIIYSQSTFTSFVETGYDKLIALIGSPAKTFGMHSISNGYVYFNNEQWHADFKAEVGSMYLDHGNALSSLATIAAYRHGEEWLDEMLNYLEGTVDWIESYIMSEIPLLKMSRPEGTYQIWFDFSALGYTDEQLQDLVFKQAKMGLTPGVWFGAVSSQHMRMNIATSREQIEQSFRALASVFRASVPNNSASSPCSRSSSSCC
ncbi:MalY/PatB family protein [Vibrio astriarenae]|uniref:MalY/PatB family protein n=1 Tax=Vibrio astriarenae TaxID=1481923 RepID=UPI003734F41E